MKISRYFINQNLSVGKLVIKDKDLIHRLFVVLKYKTGEKIKLFNGQEESDYLCNLLIISKKECFLDVVEKIDNKKVSVRKINVYVAIVKSDFDEMLREMVEIGANEITPIISERVERKEINYERLNRITLEACEQSGRSDIPKLNGIINLFDFKDYSEKNVCYHTEKVSQNNNVTQESVDSKDSSLVNIFIGPEGGWTEGEVKWFTSNAFIFRTLKTNVLRAKTAAVICLYDIINSY